MVRVTNKKTANTKYKFELSIRSVGMLDFVKYCGDATPTKIKAMAIGFILSNAPTKSDILNMVCYITKYQKAGYPLIYGSVEDVNVEDFSATFVDEHFTKYHINSAGSKIPKKKSKTDVPISKRLLP